MARGRCSLHGELAEDNVKDLCIDNCAFCKGASLALFYSFVQAAEKINPTLWAFKYALTKPFSEGMYSKQSAIQGIPIGLCAKRRASA